MAIKFGKEPEKEYKNAEGKSVRNGKGKAVANSKKPSAKAVSKSKTSIKK